MDAIRMQRIRALTSETTLASTFDKDFFEFIVERFEEVEKRQFKLLSLQLPIFFVLALSLLHIDVGLNFLGLTNNDIKKLHEPLIVLSACMSFVSSCLADEINYLKEILQARIDQLSGENADCKMLLSLAFGIKRYWSPDPTGMKRSGLKTFLQRIHEALFVIVTGGYALSIPAIQFLILLDVYEHPTISQQVSMIIITVCILIYALVIVNMVTRNGSFPYRRA